MVGTVFEGGLGGEVICSGRIAGLGSRWAEGF